LRRRPVRKLRALPRRKLSPPPRRLEPRIVRDPAQHDHYLDPCEQPQLGLEIRPAALELRTGGLVPRRRAARRRADVAVGEPQAVVPGNGARPARESEAVQRLVQPIAARVAREHSAGAVRAVRRRREPYDQEPGPGVAEPRDRPAPVLFGAEFALLLPRNEPAVGPEPGTAIAGDDGAGDACKSREQWS